MVKKNRKGRKHVQANKSSMDGLDFASGLERYCYVALKREGLFEMYEGESFQLLEPFQLENLCFERQSNGKGEFKLRSSNIRGISYTPDFTGKDFIIECKGRANESFPLRYKLFKKWLFDNNDTRQLHKPQNQKEIETMIKTILNSRL